MSPKEKKENVDAGKSWEEDPTRSVLGMMMGLPEQSKGRNVICSCLTPNPSISMTGQGTQQEDPQDLINPLQHKGKWIECDGNFMLVLNSRTVYQSIRNFKKWKEKPDSLPGIIRELR